MVQTAERTDLADPVARPDWPRYLPLVLSLAALWLGVLALALISWQRNGTWCYPLDDTFIHMAIAKNLVKHGVWGVTPHAFAPASSSYLWTFVLSFSYLITGVHELTPLILNLLFGSLLLVVLHRLLEEFRLSTWFTVLAMALVFLGIPLLTLVTSGMEHVLHLLLVLLFVLLVSRELARTADTPALPSSCWILPVAAGLVLVRFESLALIAIAAVLLLLRGRWRTAVALPLLAAALIGLAGLVNLHFGGMFLPNSVAIKLARAPGTDDMPYLNFLFQRAVWLLQLNAYNTMLLALLPVLWIGRAIRGMSWWEQGQQLMLIGWSALLLQTVFGGSYRSIFRYDAYAFTLALVVALIGAYHLLHPACNRRADVPRRRRQSLLFVQGIATLGVAMFLLPNWYQAPKDAGSIPVLFYYHRAVQSVFDLPSQMTNIYQQQVQMARFLHQYYNEAGVAANDIGAITYFTNIRLLDLIGLGSTEFARARLALTDEGWAAKIPAFIKKDNITLAIVYDSWFSGKGKSLLPAKWFPVAMWTIRDNRVCGDNVVTFYACDEKDAVTLVQRLVAFENTLPTTPEPITVVYPPWVYRAGITHR